MIKPNRQCGSTVEQEPLWVLASWKSWDVIWRVILSADEAHRFKTTIQTHWGKRLWLTWWTIKASGLQGDRDGQSAKHFFFSFLSFLFFFFNQQSDATWLVGLSEPELPSHLTTSGTGFAAAFWEQSRVPLRTLFGWPLSYVTDQLWKTLCACVCACMCVGVCVYLCGETLRKMDDDDVSLSVLHFSWTVFYDCGVSRFLCAGVSHIISLKMPSSSSEEKNKKIKASKFSHYLTALWMAMWLAWPLTPLPSKVSTWNNNISLCG